MNYAPVQRLRTTFFHRKVRSLKSIRLSDSALRMVKKAAQIHYFTILPHIIKTKTQDMAAFKTLPSRPLGRNGPLVPRLGLGLMGASGTYGPSPSDEERFALLDEAYRRGERFWDTGNHSMASSFRRAIFLAEDTMLMCQKRTNTATLKLFSESGSRPMPKNGRTFSLRPSSASKRSKLPRVTQ